MTAIAVEFRMTAYILPTIGGLFIGLAAMSLLASLGRVAGVSGIVWGAITGPDRQWRVYFVGGLIVGAWLLHTLSGMAIPAPPEAPLWLIVVAGLFVGIGTRIGSGCTSGHGVCGIGRRSARSLIATLTFISAGIITVFILRHVLGLGL
ncbi:YeeE/YedE family protein [Luminiphilus syltensis NOR5-1B]|uniref:YeeE/YedE family protein n=2 Tax=Luminiphilus TaxID=1341118 RepID=B8KXB4_9GAMM|nr:YeeE/YedE family protein [Luminiphilus syltensis NOR5-1B]